MQRCEEQKADVIKDVIEIFKIIREYSHQVYHSKL